VIACIGLSLVLNPRESTVRGTYRTPLAARAVSGPEMNAATVHGSIYR